MEFERYFLTMYRDYLQQLHDGKYDDYVNVRCDTDLPCDLFGPVFAAVGVDLHFGADANIVVAPAFDVDASIGPRVDDEVVFRRQCEFPLIADIG